MVCELTKACKNGFAQICLMQIRRKMWKQRSIGGKMMVNATFANQKHRVAPMIWKQIRYLQFLPKICLSVCTYLLHICPEQICTNTFFRAVRVLSGKWLHVNLSSSIWVEKFRFTVIGQDRIIFSKITAVIMLNSVGDARSYGMVSRTFRLTYSPANDVFSVVFDMFENK